MSNYVDKVRDCNYKLGDVFSSKNNTFYVITGIRYEGGACRAWYGKYRITLTRLSKKLKSQGNIADYWIKEFENKFKPLSEGQKLLYLQEEMSNE